MCCRTGATGTAVAATLFGSLSKNVSLNLDMCLHVHVFFYTITVNAGLALDAKTTKEDRVSHTKHLYLRPKDMFRMPCLPFFTTWRCHLTGHPTSKELALALVINMILHRITYVYVCVRK